MGIILYPMLKKDDILAELIGIILGDGNLYRHKRTERLRVICNSNDRQYINQIARLIKRVFYKKPSVAQRRNENTTVISLYQCRISQRLDIPCGDKIKNDAGIPLWIFSDRKYMIKCIKGLFETDGCFQEDRNNYAQYIELKNQCKRLREDAYNILRKLGFTPQRGSNYIRLAKKAEVYNFKKLIDFRNYN